MFILTIVYCLLFSLLLCPITSFQLKSHSKSMLQLRSVSKLEKLSMSKDDNSSLFIGSAGVIANIITDYSLYVLKTTGCGLPPGPFGLEGALEGISYLGIIGLVAWSAITKTQTGSGLSAGKFGLLGAAEGLSYLTILVGIVVAGLNLVDYGYLPGFLPNDKCYGV